MARPASTEKSIIEFGEWLPDFPENNNPGAIEALNVIPDEGCYVPLKQLAGVAGLTLPAPARGAATFFDRNGSPQLFAGTGGGLYQRQGSTFANRYNTALALYDDFLWQFVQFGSNIVALHPQVLPLAGEVGGLTAFSPLGGNPPIAACGARVGDFLVLGNLNNEADPDGPRQPQRIRWGGFNNIDAPWISDPATQADFNDMPSEGGAVMAITGRNQGTVFQERCISVMRYAGLPSTFDIDTPEQQRGAISTGCIVGVGAFVFGIANDGFFVWNGTNTTPIGDNKVNRYFFNRLNYGARQRIVGAVDFINKCIVWAFPTGGGTALDELIIYSYKENKFTHSVQTIEYLVSSAKLDTSIDDLLGNLDTDYPVSFDDGIYRGGRPFLAAFSTAHNYGAYTGLPMAATIDTGEFGGPYGTRIFTSNSRPIINLSANVATVKCAKRDQLLGDAVVFDAAVAQEITGECPILADARYMRFRVEVPAGATWQHARGIEITRKATGMF